MLYIIHNKQRKERKRLNKGIINKKAIREYAKEIIKAFALSTDGRAIGRSHDNVVVFIKDLLPEETAKIEIISKKNIT